MTFYKIIPSGPIKLPDGVSVGDQFRVAGRARIVAIGREFIDVTDYAQWPMVELGETTITVLVDNIQPTLLDA